MVFNRSRQCFLLNKLTLYIGLWISRLCTYYLISIMLYKGKLNHSNSPIALVFFSSRMNNYGRGLDNWEPESRYFYWRYYGYDPYEISYDLWFQFADVNDTYTCDMWWAIGSLRIFVWQFLDLFLGTKIFLSPYFVHVFFSSLDWCIKIITNTRLCWKQSYQY